MSDRIPTHRGRVRHGIHAPTLLGPVEVLAVEVVRAAAKHHRACMVEHSVAKSPSARETAQHELGKAARAMDSAVTDMIDILAGEA